MTEKQAKHGGIIGTIVKGGNNQPERIVEKHLIHENGEKEVIFMAEERIQDLKIRNSFDIYIKQFSKVAEGIK